jgi:hypothetical protein
MRYTPISADCHVDLCWLPPDLFTLSASAAMKDRMPYVTDGLEFEQQSPEIWLPNSSLCSLEFLTLTSRF